MYISPEELYQQSRIMSETRLSEAKQHRLIKEAKGEAQTNRLERIQSLVVFIGMALLPLGESLRSPISEPHSLDISTQQPEKHRA